jgi:hypothetical protein
MCVGQGCGGGAHHVWCGGEGRVTYVCVGGGRIGVCKAAPAIAHSSPAVVACRPEHVPLVLTPAFLRCLATNLRKSDSHLHAAAKKAMERVAARCAGAVPGGCLHTRLHTRPQAAFSAFACLFKSVVCLFQQRAGVCAAAGPRAAASAAAAPASRPAILRRCNGPPTQTKVTSPPPLSSPIRQSCA